VKKTFYTKQCVLDTVEAQRDFASHVLNVTAEHLSLLNLPNDGELSNFNVDLVKGVYTVNHTFTYDLQVKNSFHVIPLEKLWQ
jgi:hypothetical protein